MLGFLKKRKLKKLNAYLDYMLKEIAESRFSPVSSKELACIMADYFGGNVTIFRIVGTLTVMASSGYSETDDEKEKQQELEDELETTFEDSGKNLLTMEQLLKDSVFFEKRKILWKMLRTYNMDFGLVTVENAKETVFPEKIAYNMCLYIKTYNIVQANDRMIYFNNLIPSKDRLIQLAKSNDSAVASSTYWCMIKLPDLTDDTRRKCLKYMRTLISSDNLFYYSPDVLVVLYEEDAEDLSEFADNLVNILYDQCGMSAGIVAVPYSGNYAETLLVAEYQLQDIDPLEMRIIPDGSLKKYMPKKEIQVIRYEQQPVTAETVVDKTVSDADESYESYQTSDADESDEPYQTTDSNDTETDVDNDWDESGNGYQEPANAPSYYDENNPDEEGLHEEDDDISESDNLQADYDTPQEVYSVSDDPYDSQVMEPQYDDHSISFDTAESVSEDAFESAETAQFEDEDVSGIATDSAGEEGTDSIDEYSASEKNPIEPVTEAKDLRRQANRATADTNAKATNTKKESEGMKDAAGKGNPTKSSKPNILW